MFKQKQSRYKSKALIKALLFGLTLNGLVLFSKSGDFQQTKLLRVHVNKLGRHQMVIFSQY